VPQGSILNRHGREDGSRRIVSRGARALSRRWDARSKLMPVTLFRGVGAAPGGSPLTARAAVHEEKRQTIRSTLLGVGTLACSRCDAPIWIGDHPLSLTDQLTCPFCRRPGPARDFLSLAPPTRPARVLMRVIIP
jgi:hypothetical protein